MSTVIDLRSDLLSKPSEAAIEAISAAARRIGAFGLREDSSQRELEARIAALLGTEDALLVPTCSMANEVALLLLGSPGDVLLTQEFAHVITSEAGAPAAFAGLVAKVAPGGPTPEPESWLELFDDGDELKPRTGVLVLENTHNRSGGTPLSADYTRKIVERAKEAGIRCHLDGARLFNAAVALGSKPVDLTRNFDTVAVSLNKGLGAPLGAVLAGSAELVRRAVTVRQRLGGGIRPTAVVAAPALAMLDSWPEVAEDHRRARLIASELAELRGFKVHPPATNIVLITASADARFSPAHACQTLEQHGVRALPFGTQAIRLVTYRGLSDDDCRAAAEAIRRALGPFEQGTLKS
jgi:threonine aldolase